jgi:chromosome segregation protein
MKLAYIDMCGFRGYSARVRIEFPDRFTVIDGRNGAGKSTIFDAVEFALTGTLSKYNDATAAGETVADYIWWTGEGPAPLDRYVEVGFCDGETTVSVRRDQVADPDPGQVRILENALCDGRVAPAKALTQLCANTIIRDEHITQLSLDLKETERYIRLRSALGANDAETWIARGSEVLALAKRRATTAQQEVNSALTDVSASARRLDQVRTNIVTEATLADAVRRLQAFAGSVASADELSGPTRERMAAVNAEIESLRDLSERWKGFEKAKSQIAALADTFAAANTERQNAATILQGLLPTVQAAPAVSVDDARAIFELVSLGRQLGLRDAQCPLCMKEQSHDDFERGMQAAEETARKINDSAVRLAEQERIRRAAEVRVASATEAVRAADAEREKAKAILESFEGERMAQGLASGVTPDQINHRIAQLQQSLAAAQKDLRVLDTLRLSADLDRALRADADANVRLNRAQDRLSRALRTEAGAQRLRDAAVRAAGETLDVRLERMLPLMSELYRRLRPHTMWNDIEYSIRGDVRRFLKLQVGDELNPQFIFSSGQRRATGLAFLLSVNLSVAWSKWRSILLDDPMQHVDDFRTVHLAELCAQLVSDGRQIICAVEDAALADLLCRRLPTARLGDAKRITLGQDANGAIAIVAERPIVPVVRNSLVVQPGQLAMG